MKYLSVCSGIEAATVAWHTLGWNPVAFSEIEPFPCKILAHHYPTVPNYGDMTKFKEWPDANINVLVGGTPCQSFSIAGLRKGLDDPRGNLMLTYLAIAAKYRPTWVVWENVPGVLSSNGGKDFGTFLAGMGECGYGFAYRVLDAQFVRTDGHPYAVPQRRRRVFVVGCLGDWRRAAAVLFDSESLRGNPPPRREAGKAVAGTIGARTTAGGGLGTDFNLAGGLQAVAPCMTSARMARIGDPTGQDAVIAVAGTISKCSFTGGAGGRPEGAAGNHFIPVAHSLRGEGFDASEDGTGRGTPIVTCMAHGQGGAEITEGYAPTLNCNHEQPIAFSCKDSGLDAGEISPTLRSMGHDKSHMNGGGQVAVAFSAGQVNEQDGIAAALNTQTDPTAQFLQHKMMVRRLLPIECEKLQGFPPGYTNIPGASDSARYKALGNSMAVNVMQLIGQRIQMVEAIP